jgi:uncharacterized protein with PIN domain
MSEHGMPHRHQTVVVRCTDCGEQRVLLTEVTLRHCVGDDGWTYHTRCPQCRVRLADITTERAAGQSVEAGIRVEQWHLPAELWERRSGAPLDIADVLVFCNLLSRDEWVEAALGSEHPELP